VELKVNKTSVHFARLAGLLKRLEFKLRDSRIRYISPQIASECYKDFQESAQVIREELPELFANIPVRHMPDVNVDGNFYAPQLKQLIEDITYIFEVRANSELATPITDDNNEKRIFVSHGRASDWREVQTYLEKDIGVKTLELAQEPNLGRTILQKLEEESRRCCYAVIVMTGDDKMEGGEVRARENVLHEIGFFQGKFGLMNVCLLHEEGVNIPSNIHGLVYIPFPKNLVSASFGVMARELKAALKL
jgi:predicted nucleotide-binding protein